MVLTVSLFHSTWNSFSFTPVSPGNSNLITYSFTDRFCLVFMAPVTNRSHVFNNQVVYNYKKQYYNLELSVCNKYIEDFRYNFLTKSSTFCLGLVGSQPCDYLYLMITFTVLLPLPYDYIYLVITFTLWLHLPYNYIYLVITLTLWLPLPYDYLYLVITFTLWLALHCDALCKDLLWLTLLWLFWN